MSEISRQCLNCKKMFPLTREFYGQTPSGNFRARCRECNRKQHKEYDMNNPASVQGKWTRQNGKRRLAGPRWTADDETLIRKKLKDKCLYCEVELLGEGEIDHMTSLERGGTNEFSNLTLACLQCNRAKGALSAPEYMEWRRSRGLHCRNVFLSTQDSVPDLLDALKHFLDVIDENPAAKLANGKAVRELRNQYERLKK